MRKKNEIGIPSIVLPLDIAIKEIKKCEREINWETPNLEDFIRMNEMRAMIKGLDIPEQIIGEA